MGAGASADVSTAIRESSPADLEAFIGGCSADDRKKVLAALSEEAKPTVCICGAGNAAHVFIPLLASKGFDVNVFADFGDEAERLQKGVDDNDGLQIDDRQDPSNLKSYKGKPLKISKDAKEVVPNADVIIAALPSFAIKNVLTGLKPHLKEGAVIICMPGQGGCEFVAKEVLGSDLGKVTFAGIIPMPMNCRIKEWGKCVDLAALKASYDLAAVPAENAPKAAAVLSRLLDKPVRCLESFLGIALNGGNGNNHPPRLMATWGDHTPGKTYPENPLFYETWDDESEKWCEMISDERLKAFDAICEKYPGKFGTPGTIPSVREYMAKINKGQIKDDSSIKNVFATNVGLKGFHFPMKKNEAGEWEIDFTNRYFMEDIPEGLCVYKGYAELAGVPTPGIDAILMKFQSFMGKEYLVDGKLCGKDCMATKSPQAYGIKSLEELL
jgi:hypothetical protein